MDSWRPELEPGGALHQRLSAAIARDIASGALPAGLKLPPQRILADRLKLSVGTVTRAYVEAERRGLVTAHVGRGTFVAAPASASAPFDAVRDRPIDLAVNVIPHDAAARLLADTLGALRRRADLFDLLAYAPAAGAEAHRQAAARWLEETSGYRPPAERLVITNGAQQAMALALGTVCRPGDGVLCEAQTFYGIKSLAEERGCRLTGVALDDEGIVPADLDHAARATGAKALYLMPTVQNPTGRTMRPTRREEIVRLARKHDLHLLEDDNYALFEPSGRNPAPRLAQLAPERTFHISGLSKCLAPGLRTGFLVCPPGDRLDAVLRSVRATTYAPSAFGALVFSLWVQDGAATPVARAQRDAVCARHALAREVLGGLMDAAGAAAPHAWLPMSELEAERAAGRALRLGVAVTPPSAPAPDRAPVAGLRVCLGAPRSEAELRAGLDLLASALAGDAPSPRVAAV